MANKFVRMSGNDANAGTSAALAWRTIGKALSGTGVANGDICYLGAGTYRETVLPSMISPTLETTIQGDNDGAFTGDAGEVIWTNHTGGFGAPAFGGYVLDLNAKDFLTFRNIQMIASGIFGPVNAETLTSTNITFDNCYLLNFSVEPCIECATAFNTPLNWTVNRCLIIDLNGASSTYPIITRASFGVGADYDLNFQVADSVIWGIGGGSVYQTSLGTAQANRGGGVDFSRCTIIGTFITSGSNVSTTIPSRIIDSIIYGEPSLQAGQAGAIFEDGGNIWTGSLVNVTASTRSRGNNFDYPAPILSLAHEWMWGMQPRRFLAPQMPGLLHWIPQSGSAPTDLENRTRADGDSNIVATGTATAGGLSTLTDTSKSWIVNEHVGRMLRLVGGTGGGQVEQVGSNTANVLTVIDGAWQTTPAAGTTYVLYDGPPVATIKPTSSTTTTITVSGANWPVNKWQGYLANVTAGTQVGQLKAILSNTATVLTVQAFPGALDTTSRVEIALGGSNPTLNLRASGALELHDDARPETVMTDAGGTGIVFSGHGSQDFQIPVDAVSTVISVRARYDAAHGTIGRPRADLLANGEIGVAAQSVSLVAAADTWGTITLAAFTPTGKGVVVLRLFGRSDTPYGKTFFDSVVIG